MMNRRVFPFAIAALAVVAHPGAGVGAKKKKGGKVMLERVVCVNVFV